LLRECRRVRAAGDEGVVLGDRAGELQRHSAAVFFSWSFR
jgi:hypothetical protein